MVAMAVVARAALEQESATATKHVYSVERTPDATHCVRGVHNATRLMSMAPPT
jgi:hypothetical protein